MLSPNVVWRQMTAAGESARYISMQQEIDTWKHCRRFSWSVSHAALHSSTVAVSTSTERSLSESTRTACSHRRLRRNCTISHRKISATHALALCRPQSDALVSSRHTLQRQYCTRYTREMFSRSFRSLGRPTKAAAAQASTVCSVGRRLDAHCRLLCQ